MNGSSYKPGWSTNGSAKKGDKKLLSCHSCGGNGHISKFCQGGDSAVFIGELPPSYTEDDIQAHFKPHGTVKSIKVGTSVDGAKWAFVNLATKEEAIHAVKELKGEEVKGREITIKLKDEGMWRCPDPSCNKRNFETNPNCLECDLPQSMVKKMPK